MIKQTLLSITLGLSLAACNQNPAKNREEAPINQKCFMAVSNADSAFLSFGEKNNRIVGTLKFNFETKDDTEGTISGEFIGDTLFTEYAYQYKGVKYSNPQVFLKRDNKLIQGHGKMRTTLGRTYFENHADIVFDAFEFENSECK